MSVTPQTGLAFSCETPDRGPHEKTVRTKVINMMFFLCIQYIKTTSGGLLKRKFPYMNRLVWGRSGIWSVGYFVSTVGINESNILNYVRTQDEDDRGQQQFEF